MTKSEAIAPEVTPKELDGTIERLNMNKLQFGISYLDDACGGILSNDLVVFAASSGMGKTSGASAFAYYNAVNGHTVTYLALEAFKYEIELRIVFQMASQLFAKEKRMSCDCTLTDYLENRVPKELIPYINDSKAAMRILSKSLMVKYRDKNDYNINQFERDMKYFSVMSDLIIIDHLHFFDYDETKQYSEITAIMKRLRDMALLYDTPIILLSQLKKPEGYNKKYIPSLHDLHGSSNIYKVASKVVLMFPDFKTERQTPTDFPTIFRVVKNRYNGAVTRYGGVHTYDLTSNAYDKKYMPIKISYDELCYEYMNSGFPKWMQSKEVAR